MKVSTLVTVLALLITGELLYGQGTARIVGVVADSGGGIIHAFNVPVKSERRIRDFDQEENICRFRVAVPVLPLAARDDRDIRLRLTVIRNGNRLLLPYRVAGQGENAR